MLKRGRASNAPPPGVLVRVLGRGDCLRSGVVSNASNVFMAAPGEPKKARRYLPQPGLWLPASEGGPLLVELPDAAHLRGWAPPDAPPRSPPEGIVLQLPPGCLLQVDPREGLVWSPHPHPAPPGKQTHKQQQQQQLPVVYVRGSPGETSPQPWREPSQAKTMGAEAKLSVRLHDGPGEDGGGVKNAKLNFTELVETAKRVEICKHTGRKSGSSHFLGVSKHRKSGRFEAHVWMPEKRRQIYLGGFSCGMAAACAYDLVALKVKGESTTTNFRNELYQPYRAWIKSISLAEIISHIRRQSRGFSRGHSKFRGVTQHPNGRWEARIGVGTKHHVYLGLYGSQESAAQHYDEALVRLKGESAATNFPLGNYSMQLEENQTMSCQPFLKDGRSTEESKKAAMKWIKYGSRQARISRGTSFCEE